MRIRAGKIVPTFSHDLAHPVHVAALQPGLGARHTCCLLLLSPVGLLLVMNKIGPWLVIGRQARGAHGLARVVVARTGLLVVVVGLVVDLRRRRGDAVGAGYVGFVA